MPFRTTKFKEFENKKFDKGECARLVQAMIPSIGLTSTWKQGDSVAEALKKGTLTKGTAIAIFVEGKYENTADGRSHAAIFLRAVPGGMEVFDQYKDPKLPEKVKLPGARVIHNRGADACELANPSNKKLCRWTNDGDRYSVIEH